MSNFYTWKKGESIQLSKNFNTKEFSCRCYNKECVDQKIDKTLIEKLQKVRDNLGFSITVTSAYRCLAHNTKIKGSTKSQHLLGKAVDLIPSAKKDLSDPKSYMDILRDECRKYFNGIGVTHRFVHADTRRTKAEWKY